MLAVHPVQQLLNLRATRLVGLSRELDKFLSTMSSLFGSRLVRFETRIIGGNALRSRHLLSLLVENRIRIGFSFYH